MDKKVLRAAADTMRELDLCEISIKDGDTEIVLKRAQPVNVPAAPTAPVPATASASQTAADEESGKDTSEHSFIDCAQVTSPLIGIFYSSPSPEAPPYVRSGDKVKKGDVLCLVEAMKMMNEICAECDGTVLDVCAENGAMVEYGQVLFKISAR